jgi:2-polyprenyl-3-methyl-5-hydroxy-6-metoxy-1,4-benzoquinol methylase
MNEKSYLYRWPNVYKLGLRLIPGKKYDEMYKCIVDLIKQDITVLVAACGPAILPYFLKDARTRYTGFDINESFVAYAKKRGLNAYRGNAFEDDSYQVSDVIIFCDVMHHFGIDNEKKALEKAVKFAKKKIVICEPQIDNYLSLLPQWFPGRKSLLEWWFNYIEKDGANQVSLHQFRSREELREVLMNGYDVIPKSYARDLKEIGENFIISYTR